MQAPQPDRDEAGGVKGLAEGGLSVAWELREGQFRNRDERGAASNTENSTSGYSCVLEAFLSQSHVNKLYQHSC